MFGFVCIHGPIGVIAHGIPPRIEQTPNGIIFMPGTMSNVVPTGVLQQKLHDGVALNGVGQLPNEHIQNVPVLTINPIFYNINFERSTFSTKLPTFSSAYLLFIIYFFVGLQLALKLISSNNLSITVCSLLAPMFSMF